MPVSLASEIKTNLGHHHRELLSGIKINAAGELLTIQQSNHLYWVHEDSVTKSKRITDVYGNVMSTIELDPWGADTNRSSNSAFLPQSFATYIRDGNGQQDAMARRYSVGGTFAQPDPYGGVMISLTHRV